MQTFIWHLLAPVVADYSGSVRRRTTCGISQKTEGGYAVCSTLLNRLSDFRHMVELFTRRDESYFARTVGVNNLRSHFNNLEKAVRSLTGDDGVIDGSTAI